MMVPAWTLFALTVVFLIREIYIRSKQKLNDFDTGYRQAIKDFANKWNKMASQSLEPRAFNDEIRVYLQQLIINWDVKQL